MTEASKGVWAITLACTTWGLSALFYRELDHLPPLEVLAHRTIWSFAFFCIVLTVQSRVADLVGVWTDRKQAFFIAVAAFMISGNWFGFIYSVSNGYTLEASLGYYIFPLVAVLLGRLILGERLNRLQGTAVILAALAVAILSVGLGSLPVVSLWLAVTFGFYGLIKNRLSLGPMISVAAEVALLLPIALAWIALKGTLSFGDMISKTGVFLILSGLLTGGPLLLFSFAARRLRMSTVGLAQYVNPSLQFLVSVLFFAGIVTPWHGVALPLIWAALALYSFDSVSRDRR